METHFGLGRRFHCEGWPCFVPSSCLWWLVGGWSFRARNHAWAAHEPTNPHEPTTPRTHEPTNPQTPNPRTNETTCDSMKPTSPEPTRPLRKLIFTEDQPIHHESRRISATHTRLMWPRLGSCAIVYLLGTSHVVDFGVSCGARGTGTIRPSPVCFGNLSGGSIHHWPSPRLEGRLVSWIAVATA